jgi:tetratricopeptide (TPR) repeat protein
VVLAVLWDDISGPSIISLHPLIFDDPESIALQIYLASVTVFGQHGQSQRTEFTVPLLSLGKDIQARVAFDAWYDTSLRGEERPFFLSIISKHEYGNLLNTHLDTAIFSYLDILKEEKNHFEAKVIWEKIQDSINRPSLTDMETEQSILDSDYAIPRALQDLQTSMDAWEKLKDRSQLWTAIKIANRLEKIDDKAAGEAFLLTGAIFQANNNYEDAQNAFEQASEAFSRVHEFKRSGEAFCLAGRNAYLLGNNEKAIELYQGGSVWIKESIPLASLQYDIALVYQDLQQFNEANTAFEKAVNLAEEFDFNLSAKYSATYASKLLIQAEKEKELNPTYSLGLMRKSAELRIKSADSLKRSDEGFEEAATSLTLAGKIYFSIGNEGKAVNLVNEASSLFKQIGKHFSSIKTLYDGARTVESEENKLLLLNKALNVAPEVKDEQPIQRLLGLITFEIAKLKEAELNTYESYSLLDQSLKYLKNGKAIPLELIPVQIQYGNVSFNMENFEQATTMFFQAHELLKGLKDSPQVDTQKKRCLANALISLRRGSTLYHNAGVVALSNQQERSAIEHFTHSTSLLIDWVENNIVDSTESIEKVVKDRIGKLTIKLSIFTLAESKFKLEALISDLNSL